MFMIGGDDEAADLTLGHAIDLFEDNLHFRRGRRTHDEGDGPAIGPAAGLGFADLDQVSEGDGAHGIGFVRNQGEIPRRRQGSADEDKYGNTQKALVEHSSSPAGRRNLRVIVREEGSFLKGN
jgi:hypothetical protein